jgi:prophage regulatory protein
LVSSSTKEETKVLHKIYRLPEVKVATGLSRSSIYAYIAGGKFPPPLKLGARSSGWLESEIDAWLSARADSRPRAIGNLHA